MPPESWCGILVHAQLGIGDSHPLEHLDGERACRLLVELLVEHDRLDDLVADGIHRAQGRHRILEDHGDVVAADGTHLSAIVLEPDEIDHAALLAAEADGAAHDSATRVGQQTHHRQGGYALAGAALTHYPDGFSGVHREIDAIYGMHHPVVGEEPGVEIFDLQQGCVTHALLEAIRRAAQGIAGEVAAQYRDDDAEQGKHQPRLRGAGRGPRTPTLRQGTYW